MISVRYEVTAENLIDAHDSATAAFNDFYGSSMWKMSSVQAEPVVEAIGGEVALWRVEFVAEAANDCE